MSDVTEMIVKMRSTSMPSKYADTMERLALENARLQGEVEVFRRMVPRLEKECEAQAIKYQRNEIRWQNLWAGRKDDD